MTFLVLSTRSSPFSQMRLYTQKNIDIISLVHIYNPNDLHHNLHSIVLLVNVIQFPVGTIS